MRSVNKVILIGNVTRDPEMRQTPNGQPVTTFGLATNRQWITQDGQKHSLAEYHELVAWARLAEICNQYVKKGKLLYIEGYLKTRSWDTPEGVRKFKTEVIIQDMIMLEKRPPEVKLESESEYLPEEETAPEGTLASRETESEEVKEEVKEEEESKEGEEKSPKKKKEDIIGQDLGL